MMDDEARAREFEREMVRAIDQLHREIAYNATRWRQMIGEHGGVGAARRLLEGTDASDGFTRLWETQRLDMSVEWFVLVYVDLFTDDGVRPPTNGFGSTTPRWMHGCVSASGGGGRDGDAACGSPTSGS